MDRNAVSVRELKFLCVGNDYFHVSETIISLRRNCQVTRLCVSGDTVRFTSFYSAECI